MKQFTEEQMTALARFEDNFHRAIEGNWYRNVPTEDVTTLSDMAHYATGTRPPISYGCGACTLNLLKTVGRLYFSQKENQKKRTKKVK